MTNGHGLWVKFYALRASILATLEAGVDDNDPRIVQARQQQRLVAEQLTREGHAKGIAFEREGDLHRDQQAMARVFDQMPPTIAAQEHDRGKPPVQVIRLKALRFKMTSGRIGVIAPPPNQVIGIETLRAESRAATLHNRPESAMEGKAGVDYEVGQDPDSKITMYTPITDS